MEDVSFFDATTIHGVKEVSRKDFPFSRYIWLTILLGCMCGVTYEISQVITYYQSNPSASQIKWVVQDEYDYPDMIFCPKVFLDMEKVKRLNLSGNGLAYAVSLFQEIPLPEKFDLGSARKEIKQIMKQKNLTKYMALFAAVTFDGSKVLKDANTGEYMNTSLYIPGYGVCYELHLKPVKSKKVRSIQHVELIYHPPNVSSEYDSMYGTTMLVREVSGIKADMILMKNNAFYQIDFSVEVHKRLSRPGAECFTPANVPNNYYIGDCEFNCIENETQISGCKSCINYVLIDTVVFDKHVWPCSHFRLDSLPPQNESIQPRCTDEAIVDRAANCLHTCLPVCEQWIFKHSTLVFDYQTEYIHIRLLYNPTDGILTYEEVPTYTFDTFISNIGGQLGLWLGASMVSLFQTFYYSCLSIVNHANVKFNKK